MSTRSEKLAHDGFALADRLKWEADEILGMLPEGERPWRFVRDLIEDIETLQTKLADECVRLSNVSRTYRVRVSRFKCTDDRELDGEHFYATMFVETHKRPAGAWLPMYEWSQAVTRRLTQRESAKLNRKDGVFFRRDTDRTSNRFVTKDGALDAAFELFDLLFDVSRECVEVEDRT